MRLTSIRNKAKRWIPVGSPLWYPQFYSRRWVQAIRNPSSVKKVLWCVVHQNILLEEYKAIYFYIPKVACSTLSKVCAELLSIPIPAGDLEEEIHLLDFPCAKKYKVKDYYGGYFKFSYVRNPWSRLVSCYNDKVNYDKGHVYEKYENTFIEYLKRVKVYSKDMTFERFVEIICDIPDDAAEAHFRSQYLFITDECGNILVDFIGRFEQLEADFKHISEKLKIRADLPHIRSGKPRKYTDYYSSRSMRLVERRYGQDIEMFGYTY